MKNPTTACVFPFLPFRLFAIAPLFLSTPQAGALVLALASVHTPQVVVTPPQATHRLRMVFTTGGDNLRGGNDNLDVFIVLSDRSMLRFYNVNNGREWGNGSRNTVEVNVPSDKASIVGDRGSGILAVRLEFHGSGGIGGDNWNLDRFEMDLITPSGTHRLLERSGAPLFRFTGDARVLQIRVSGSGPVEVLPVSTRFTPATHGFRFINAFKVPLGLADVTWEGLCGGMSYVALDYFYNNLPIPTQPYMPARGHPLFQLIWDRQMQSIGANLDKWAEHTFNPGGARNREFFTWGLQMGSGRLGELRRHLENGRPVVICLVSLGGAHSKHHQVVACGLQLNNYYGNLAEGAENVRIFVYDPNFPGQTKVLCPNVRDAYWYYEGERPFFRWRTYFVDMKYRATRPSIPPTPSPRNEVWAMFKTGGDDLRGGDDNVHMILLLRDGREIRFENVNRRHRWIDNSWNDVACPLPDALTDNDVVGIRLETTSRGGLGGDNWNLDRLIVLLRFGASRDWTAVLDRAGTPLKRFTGSDWRAEWRWR